MSNAELTKDPEGPERSEHSDVATQSPWSHLNELKKIHNGYGVPCQYFDVVEFPATQDINMGAHGIKRRVSVIAFFQAWTSVNWPT
jgi:hypothetical protein